MNENKHLYGNLKYLCSSSQHIFGHRKSTYCNETWLHDWSIGCVLRVLLNNGVCLILPLIFRANLRLICIVKLREHSLYIVLMIHNWICKYSELTCWWFREQVYVILTELYPVVRSFWLKFLLKRRLQISHVRNQHFCSNQDLLYYVLC